MDDLWQDLRHSLRVLRRAPGFSAVVVSVLALGIGANTAIFSVVNAVLLRPLPYRDADRLVLLRETLKDRFAGVTVPNFVDWREQNQVFAEIAARERATFTLTGRGDAERVPGVRVTHSYFPMIGVAPLHGRLLLPEDDVAGAAPVAMLGEGLWRRRFGGDKDAVGRRIDLDGRSHILVGVLPAGFEIPGGAEELWVPLALGPEDLRATGSHRLSAIARLKPGLGLARAAEDMKGIARRLESVRPHSNQGWSVDVGPLHERLVENARPSVLLLSAAVGLVVLVACANVANLLLARAARRQREIAVRAAIGASRARLLRQLLAESLLLALLGGAAGLLAAFWGTDLLLLLLPGGIPRLSEVRLDGAVLGFTLLLSLVTGALFGLAPAFHASKATVRDSLKEGSRGAGTGRASERLRGALMVSEIALALLLLAGAGLLGRSFLRLQAVAPGFLTDDLLALQMALPASRYADGRQVCAFYDQVLEKAAALPGVAAVAATSHLPIGSGGFSLSVFAEGAPARPSSDVPTAFYRAVTPNYFQALGIRIARGRAFDARDRAGAPRVAIVNATMARLLWKDDPIGKRFTLDDDEKAPLEVVGVVSDVRHFGLDNEPRPELHIPYLQAPEIFWRWNNRSLTVVMRGSVESASLAPAVRAAVGALDNDLPVYNVRTMEAVIAASVAARRASLLLVSVFACVALLLASVGLYGVVSYSVSQRTHEFGVRMALGAGEADLLRLVLGRGVKLAAAGLLLGLAGALALSRLLSTMVFGISARDPLTLAAVGALLLFVALLASYLPARRAARVDPVTALRYE